MCTVGVVGHGRCLSASWWERVEPQVGEPSRTKIKGLSWEGIRQEPGGFPLEILEDGRVEFRLGAMRRVELRLGVMRREELRLGVMKRARSGVTAAPGSRGGWDGDANGQPTAGPAPLTSAEALPSNCLKFSTNIPASILAWAS